MAASQKGMAGLSGRAAHVAQAEGKDGASLASAAFVTSARKLGESKAGSNASAQLQGGAPDGCQPEGAAWTLQQGCPDSVAGLPTLPRLRAKTVRLLLSLLPARLAAVMKV